MSCALFIYAHPDDETFGAAGTICLLRSKGWRVVLACATLGDKGKCGEPAICTQQELPGFRERELRDAACVLDISEIHLLGYRDKELTTAPPDDIRRKLVSVLRAEKPEFVFTFDPNGFNVHPDHVAISRFTSDAVAAAADGRWYPERGEPHVVRELLWTTLLEPWQEALGDVHEKPSADVILDVSPWAGKKEDALRAHRTQHKSVEHHFFSKPNLQQILGVETWRYAWPRSHPRATDALHFEDSARKTI
jgi:N-acetylglucosamine malate deacetylase 2